MYSHLFSLVACSYIATTFHNAIQSTDALSPGSRLGIMPLLDFLTVNILNPLDSNSFHFRVEWVEVNNIKHHEGCMYIFTKTVNHKPHKLQPGVMVNNFGNLKNSIEFGSIGEPLLLLV